MKIYGFIPARMASSRLPGKPLKHIQGRPMLEHVYERANFFKKRTKLSIATCDQKIRKASKVRSEAFLCCSTKLLSTYRRRFVVFFFVVFFLAVLRLVAFFFEVCPDSLTVLMITEATLYGSAFDAGRRSSSRPFHPSSIVPTGIRMDAPRSDMP